MSINFKDEKNETTIKMFTWFTNIVNGLQFLRKVHTKLKKMMKILRSQPKQWEAKVITYKRLTISRSS